MQTNLSMLCQNVNPRREVQQEYVGHAVATSYSIGYSWGYPCLITVKNNIKENKCRQSFKISTFSLFHQ